MAKYSDLLEVIAERTGIKCRYRETDKATFDIVPHENTLATVTWAELKSAYDDGQWNAEWVDGIVETIKAGQNLDG